MFENAIDLKQARILLIARLLDLLFYFIFSF